MKNPPGYDVWRAMIRRCCHLQNRQYRHYGGRGITVCERWRNSFSAFKADMGLPPPGLTLDRINNDGNYEPSNCRWATYVQQANNTRRNRYVFVDGQILTLAQAARHFGVPDRRLANYYDCNGFDINRAVKQLKATLERESVRQ